MTLYPRISEPALSPDLFRAPAAEYRGAPFWSWNCRLERERLIEQFDLLRAMGMGGAHVHARTGLATEYLGEEFLGHVQACAAHAQAQGAKLWLYDEDRWPSGFAGGLVTSDPELGWHQLLITRRAPGERKVVGGVVDHIAVQGAGGGRELARWAIRRAGGALSEHRRLASGEAAGEGEELWYAVLERNAPSPWFNHRAYVDVMNPTAIARFVEVTHERYRAAVGEHFGGTIPAIFTDEPQCTHCRPAQRGDDGRDLVLAWTPDFADSYRAVYGAEVLDTLPEVLWERADGQASLHRWRYHDHRCERFAAAYGDTIGGWCSEHGIAFTGHLMMEESLHSQTVSLGEAMRHFRSYQIPGIDLLCDKCEFTTAKQAVSAARQFGREGVLSELYGVTNWDFDFQGHKRQGDWQAALGITVRVHHLSWVSMAGEAKRDYPAPIDEHSPWWREYPAVEDHFARLNTVLVRGRARVRVAMVHPIESYWLCYGPDDATGAERRIRDRAFHDATAWLVNGLIDCDYLSESLLPIQAPVKKARRLVVGRAAYDAVLLPDLKTIRSSTLDRLEAFAAAGGLVVFAGEAPALVDCRPSDRARRLAERCQRVPWRRESILAALEPLRELAVEDAHGLVAPSLVSQLRDDGKVRWCFICNTDRERGLPDAQVRLRGRWRVEIWNTLDGSRSQAAWCHHDGWTLIPWDCPAAGSLLLRLEPAPAAVRPPRPRSAVRWRELARLDGSAAISLDEPNVLLLDRAAFRFDDGPWEGAEELLRLDNRLRARCGWPPVGANIVQPWVDPPAPCDHRLRLRFAIETAVAVKGARLALERAGDARLLLDGRPVKARPDGWWVDRCFGTVALPELAIGSHRLEIELPHGRGTTLEWCYLLGSFGVELAPGGVRLVPRPRRLRIGDQVSQGLPFYAGNVTWHFPFSAPGGRLAIRLPCLGGPCAAVSLDGRRCGLAAFAPWQVELGRIAAGRHELAITVFGNRVNAFGPVHLADPEERWIGPNAWRSTGGRWRDAWQLKPTGLLAAPVLLA